MSLIKINDLYHTIAEDLKIYQFENESFENFQNRLIYSTLGMWILTLFSDRDFENDDLKQISKVHVTLEAQNILNSYQKIAPSIKNYFNDESINLIEDTYIHLGYIKNGKYSFKLQEKAANIKIADRYLSIKVESDKKKMRGLGLWIPASNDVINLDNYLLINESALAYTKKLISQLKFSSFDSKYGTIELYNVAKNQWDPYSEYLANQYEYTIAKIDDGLNYIIIKQSNGKKFSASLPIIYTNKGKDFVFEHEVWRIILGICAINKKNAKCVIHTQNDFITIKFKGFILPALESSIVRAMSWPKDSSTNPSEFITDKSMKPALIELLSRFSLDIQEGSRNGK